MISDGCHLIASLLNDLGKMRFIETHLIEQFCGIILSLLIISMIEISFELLNEFRLLFFFISKFFFSEISDEKKIDVWEKCHILSSRLLRKYIISKKVYVNIQLRFWSKKKSFFRHFSFEMFIFSMEIFSKPFLFVSFVLILLKTIQRIHDVNVRLFIEYICGLN